MRGRLFLWRTTAAQTGRCGQGVARLIALVYNWWNIFTRLAQRDHHLEAVTSRPLLHSAVHLDGQ